MMLGQDTISPIVARYLYDIGCHDTYHAFLDEHPSRSHLLGHDKEGQIARAPSLFTIIEAYEALREDAERRERFETVVGPPDDSVVQSAMSSLYTLLSDYTRTRGVPPQSVHVAARELPPIPPVGIDKRAPLTATTLLPIGNTASTQSNARHSTGSIASHHHNQQQQYQPGVASVLGTNAGVPVVRLRTRTPTHEASIGSTAPPNTTATTTATTTTTTATAATSHTTTAPSASNSAVPRSHVPGFPSLTSSPLVGIQRAFGARPSRLDPRATQQQQQAVVPAPPGSSGGAEISHTELDGDGSRDSIQEHHRRKRTPKRSRVNEEDVSDVLQQGFARLVDNSDFQEALARHINEHFGGANSPDSRAPIPHPDTTGAADGGGQAIASGAGAGDSSTNTNNITHISPLTVPDTVIKGIVADVDSDPVTAKLFASLFDQPLTTLLQGADGWETQDGQGGVDQGTVPTGSGGGVGGRGGDDDIIEEREPDRTLMPPPPPPPAPSPSSRPRTASQSKLPSTTTTTPTTTATTTTTAAASNNTHASTSSTAAMASTAAQSPARLCTDTPSAPQASRPPLRSTSQDNTLNTAEVFASTATTTTNTTTNSATTSASANDSGNTANGAPSSKRRRKMPPKKRVNVDKFLAKLKY